MSEEERFAARTEKNIYQADLFDEAGIESEEAEEEQNIVEVKNHQRNSILLEKHCLLICRVKKSFMI